MLGLIYVEVQIRGSKILDTTINQAKGSDQSSKVGEVELDGSCLKTQQQKIN